MEKLTGSSQSGGGKMLFAAVLAVVAAVAFLAYRFVGVTDNPPESGRATAEPFLAAIRSGNASAAWETTTAEFKSNQGRENFLKYVEQHPLVKEPLEFYNFQTVTINGLSCAECAFGKQGAPGSGPKVRVLLAKEQGKWKVERLIADELKPK